MIVNDLSIHGLIGGGGKNIKSLQRGSHTMTATSNNITINSVDISKSIVKISIKSNSATGNERVSFVLARLANSTTLTLEIDLFSAGIMPVVEWEVIEFNNVKSLQRGTFTFSATSTNVTITSVDTTKSVIFFSHTCQIASGFPGRSIMSGKISNATTLNFAQVQADSKSVHWQVIEFK